MAKIIQADSLPCSNTIHPIAGVPSQCPKSAKKPCSECYLVQYCSGKCEKEHRSLHKTDCGHDQSKDSWKPDWSIQKRTPTFLIPDDPLVERHVQKKKNLLGSVPAVDILRIKDNEKGDLPEQLNLLFAASGDMRNVVKTIAELPASFNGKVEVVTNDLDFDIVTRNTILLLTTLLYGPEKAVPFVIHLWYSALIPDEIYKAIREDILPLIEDVCTKIQQKPANSKQSKTWTYGSRSLGLILPKSNWDILPAYFYVPDDFTPEKAQTVRKETMLAPHRIDDFHRAQFNRPPAWRVAFLRFREDGLLLPFGIPRESFNVPNPTFYHNTDSWPMSDTSDALDGWSMAEVRQKSLASKNDIYGSLYFYIQGILQTFHRRLSTLQIRFQLLQIDATELPETLKEISLGGPSFDRIEISNIADRTYLGPSHAPQIFSPLLKRPSSNPHATLLGHFLYAVRECITGHDQIADIVCGLGKLNKYIPFKPYAPGEDDITNPYVVQMSDLPGIFRDFDKYFDRYVERYRFLEAAATAGLMVKERNTVVEKWPMRIGEGASKKEFRALIAGGHWGSERYVEWIVKR